MQRLLSLGMLAAVLGGGYAVLNGWKPADVQRVVGAAGSVVQGAASNQYQYPQQGYGAPAVNGAVGQGYDSAAPGFAPTPVAPSSVIRIATYNIQVFGDSKASNMNVMRTLAAIVQQFDIVAIQEIRTKDAYFIDKFLRDYVNAGGRRYSRLVGERLGRSNSKEQYAYLYDTATIQVNPNLIYTVNDDANDLLHREPFVAMFATRVANPFTFILVNTHTDPDETDQELDALAQVLDVVRRYGPGEDDVILLGDLNTAVSIKPAAGSFGVARSSQRQLEPRDLRALGRIPGIYPVIRDQPTNTRKNKLHDNILVNRGSTTEFTGRAGVFDLEQQYGLTREQALMVSDHLPVWAEFSIVEGGTPGRMASGAPAIGR
ncbi:MAG: endonuclease/exonuclease/phosphatase family protein [Planctomycetota bacterium]